MTRVHARRLAYLLLALVLGALVASAWLLHNDSRLRVWLETGVSAASGRPFRIDGDFALSLGRVITVRGSDIRWLNAPWSSQPDMLAARRVSLAIDLWSLLRGPIVISDVQVEDARLTFEWNADGQFNWAMGAARADADADPLRLVLGQSALSDVAIRVRHPRLRDELRIDVRQASQKRDAQDRLQVSADALIDQRPFTLQGSIGPFAGLIAGGAIDYDFDLAGAGASLKAGGHFDRLADPRSPRLHLALVATEAQDVLQVLALPVLTRGSIDLQGRLAPAADQLSGTLKGNFGEFKLDASVTTKAITSFDELSLQLRSTGPGIAALGQLIGVDDLPDRPYSLLIDASRHGPKLQVEQLSLSSQGLEFEARGVAHHFPEARGLELDVVASADNLHAVGRLLSLGFLPALPLRVKATVRSEAAGGKGELSGQLSLGNISGEVQGALSRESRLVGSTFRYHATSPDLRELARARGIDLPLAASTLLPARIEGDLTVLPEQLRIDRISGQLVDNQLAASGLVDFRPATARLDFEPRIEGPDLARLLAVVVGDGSAVHALAGPFQASGKLSLEGARLRIANANAQVAGGTFAFDGSLGLGGRTPAIDARIGARGDNLAALLRPETVSGVPAAAYSLSATLKGSDAGLALDDLQFSLAETQLSGRLASGWPGDPERLDFDLVAAGRNLRTSLPQISGYVAAPVAFRVEARGSADQAGVDLERLDATLADARIDLAGRIVFKPAFAADAVRLSLKGSRLSDLGQLQDWQPIDLPFALKATMTGSAGSVQMEGVQASLGNSDLDGSVSIRVSPPARPRIDLSLRSNYLDLRPLLARAPEKAGKASEAGGAGGQRRKLFSDEPLPVDLLKAIDGTLRASLARVEARQQQLQQVRADASLQNGVLVVKQLQGQAREGKLAASFRVDARASKPAVTGQFQASDVILYVRGTARDDEARLPHLRVDSRFSASGNSMAALAAGLDGYLWLRSSPGQFRALDLGVLFGDFAFELFSALNPFARKKPYSTLTCGGAYLEARNGRVDSAPALVLQTESLSVVAKGSIDLRSEKIDFAFKTVPLEGVGLSAGNLINPFIKLGGTLQEPALDLDVRNAAVESGVAAATMGLSIVAGGLWDRWIGSAGACERIEKEARKLRQAKGPGDVPPP